MATTEKRQPLDLPVTWAHGKHVVQYGEIALTPEEADYAAFFLQRNATYLMAVQVHQTLKHLFPNARGHPRVEVQAAYQISRMIRNAFAHNVSEPVWSIDNDCRNCVFEIAGIIRFDTTSLNGKPFDWRDYGGLLVLLRLSQFVRERILGQTSRAKHEVSLPSKEYFQQGNLILRRLSEEEVQEVLGDARKVVEGDEIDLGDGHGIRGSASLYHRDKKD